LDLTLGKVVYCGTGHELRGGECPPGGREIKRKKKKGGASGGLRCKEVSRKQEKKPSENARDLRSGSVAMGDVCGQSSLGKTEGGQKSGNESRENRPEVLLVQTGLQWYQKLRLVWGRRGQRRKRQGTRKISLVRKIQTYWEPSENIQIFGPINEGGESEGCRDEPHRIFSCSIRDKKRKGKGGQQSVPKTDLSLGRKNRAYRREELL